MDNHTTMEVDTMYRCLLVDDDHAICQGLPMLIDWEACGFTVAATASNGLQALERLRQEHFDLLVTDIRMPRMDGIELIRTLQEEGIMPDTIILSGYRDFEYAQMAVAYGVRQYILKPVKEQLLVDTLNGLRAKMTESELLRERLRESQSILAEHSWLDLLKENRQPSECRHDLELAGLPSEGFLFRVAILETVEERTNALLRAVQQAVAEIRESGVSMRIARMDRRRCVLLMACAERTEVSSRQIVERVAAGTAGVFGKPLRLAVGSETSAPDGISLSCRDAGLLLELNAFAENDGILWHDELRMNRVIAPILEHIRAHCHEKLSLRGMAVRHYLNPAYLGRLFRQQTGMSFNDFLVDCRMELARKHLQDRNRMISDIAAKVGYEDVNHFCHVFKTRNGMTPSEFRARMTKDLRET